MARRVYGVLLASGVPLSVPQVEWLLKAHGHWDADTFDVRDAVAEVIAAGKAVEVNPGRLVRVKE